MQASLLLPQFAASANEIALAKSASSRITVVEDHRRRGSPSSRITIVDLPPIWSVARLKVSTLARRIARPAPVDSVNETWQCRGFCSFAADNIAPAVDDVDTPAGKPA